MRICKHFFYLYYFSFFFSLGDVFLNLYEFFWIWNLEGGREEGKEGGRGKFEIPNTGPNKLLNG